jgi:hypothetical protein
MRQHGSLWNRARRLFRQPADLAPYGNHLDILPFRQLIEVHASIYLQFDGEAREQQRPDIRRQVLKPIHG